MAQDAEAVLEANEAFYRAFDLRDVDAMDGLWAREHPVACIHPGWAPLHGRPSVLSSWQQILTGPNPPRITCTEAVAHLYGGSALVVCTERLDGGALVATNVFAREASGWKLVHHQAGPMPAPADPPAAGTVH